MINTKLSQIKLPKFQQAVDNKLIRGRAISCPYRLYKMKCQGINQIVDLGQNNNIKRFQEKFFCKLFGIKFLAYDWSFKTGELLPSKIIDNINKFIISNKGTTYMHCKRGKHRTGIAVAIYEKLHTTKSDTEIIQNFVKNSKDLSLAENKIVHRNKNAMKIISDMLEKYFPSFVPQKPIA